MKSSILLTIIILQSFSLINYCNGLRIVMLDVPTPTKAGESVELSCLYDLEKDKLYSVKFYKDGFEFYRYVPKDFPPAQYLPIAGIRVDTEKSDRNKVHIKYVDLNSAGVYRCEICAEAPSFNTAADEKEMHIYVLPKEGPKITTDKADYEPGDLLQAKCSSSKSKPPATLKWFINRKSASYLIFSLDLNNGYTLKGLGVFFYNRNSSSSRGVSSVKKVACENCSPSSVSGSDYEVQYSTTLYADGLESSLLTMRFRVTEKHFHNGAISLKCAAFVREFGGKFRHEAILMAYDSRKRKTGVDYDNYVPNIGREPGRMRKSKLNLYGDLRYSDNLSSSSSLQNLKLVLILLIIIRLRLEFRI